ncbi:MAG: acetylglutamate kinase [Chloroflexi bacterium]|nr:acetylglutamate kinase [Chloroflexota bacterium]
MVIGEPSREMSVQSTRQAISKPLVVKIGGSILGNQDTTLEDLVTLQKRGVLPVVVHGGGQVISRWMEKQGTIPRFVRGFRVTDAASMEIVAAVLCGLVNKNLVASIQALGGKALGMSGVDGGMLLARVLDPELGQVGEIVQVDLTPIHQALQGGYIPVIAPVAIHRADSSAPSGTLLNVNGDTAAGEIARAMGADAMVFLTDVEGVMDSNRRLIGRLTASQGMSLVGSGTVAGGMVPKVEACLRALESVKVAQIIDGRRERALFDFVEGRPLGTRIG